MVGVNMNRHKLLGSDKIVRKLPPRAYLVSGQRWYLDPIYRGKRDSPSKKITLHQNVHGDMWTVVESGKGNGQFTEAFILSHYIHE